MNTSIRNPIDLREHARLSLRFLRNAAGSAVRVEYPLRERTVTERLGGELYTTTWRGDTVVDIDPKGKYLPIFSKSIPT